MLQIDFFFLFSMWTSVVPLTSEAKVPSSRSKHASVLHGQHLYLLGGRNGNVPLKDFWKYHIGKCHLNKSRSFMYVYFYSFIREYNDCQNQMMK